MKSLAIILFLSTIIASTMAIRYEFNATIQCRLSKNWCVQLEYYDDDYIFRSRCKTEWSCSDASQQVFNTRAVFDDGPIDRPYQNFVEIKHNCNKDGIIASFEHKFPTVQADTNFAPIVFKIQL